MNTTHIQESHKENIIRLETEIANLESKNKQLGQIGLAGFGLLLIIVFLFFSHLGTMFENDPTACVTGILLLLMLPGAIVLRKKWDMARNQLSEKQRELAQIKDGDG